MSRSVVSGTSVRAWVPAARDLFEIIMNIVLRYEVA